jgi:hypothetical protein
MPEKRLAKKNYFVVCGGGTKCIFPKRPKKDKKTDFVPLLKFRFHAK